mmetsp:Transcript_28582/g.20648  ORF Transcript_28582/g.20648 Transcript_28582/m.20648 type:complete len:92 (+) Transcript_28582:538-813(+)
MTGISVHGCYKLIRQVEMHQWVQHCDERREGDHVIRKYYYQTQWVTHLVNSDSFRDKEHTNPLKFPYQGQTSETSVKEVQLGAFRLSKNDM